MPLYEYRCATCSHEFELLVRRADTPIVCPTCGSGAATKKVSLSSFQLKGTGWYASEYAAAKQEAPSTGGCAAEAAGGSCGCKALD